MYVCMHVCMLHMYVKYVCVCACAWVCVCVWQVGHEIERANCQYVPAASVPTAAPLTTEIKT